MAPIKQQPPPPPPPPPPPRKQSQFAAATAMLGKNGKMNVTTKEVVGRAHKKTPKPTNNWAAKNFGNQSAGNLGFSPAPTMKGVGTGGVGKHSNVAPPPFVSPGFGMAKSKFPMTTSYLNTQPTETPSQTSKVSVPASPNMNSSFGGLPFSPSPAVKGGKPKLSFPATTPMARSTNTSKTAVLLPTTTTTTTSYYGGSYLSKGNDSINNFATQSPRNRPNSNNNNDDDDCIIADVKIEVKIDIQKKLKEIQKAKGSSRLLPPPIQKDNIPEHIQRLREREARARQREEQQRKAMEEIEYLAANLVQAAFLGWWTRSVLYPKLWKANVKRLEEIRRRAAAKKKLQKAILTIQSTFRMYVHRKRYLYVRDCKRRRELNAKEIKSIETTITNMPMAIKAEIKSIKKEYDEKKKAVAKDVRKQFKEEEKKMEEIKKTGEDMIAYWENQNEMIKKQIATIKNEQKILEGQFEVLAAKSEEIHNNFLSLQGWVEKKNISIKKHESDDEKARNRYLPRYRADIADRNKHCMTEFRIKEMYRKELKRIIKEVEKRSDDPSLVKNLKKDMKACNKEIAAMPQVPVPEGLERWLKS